MHSLPNSDFIPRPPIDSQPCPVSDQSHIEEVYNSITHCFGLALSLIGLVVLALYSAKQGGLGLFVCCFVFGFTMVLTYASSTLYHSARFYYAKQTLQVIDHASIYLLIAGSYTPFTLLVLEGTLGWGLFVFAWSVALVGIVLKFLMERRRVILETLMYLGMGWAALVAIVPLYQNLPLRAFVFLVAGGFFYSVGTFFYLARRIPFNHTIWHLFVMAGSACHFFAVFFSVIH